MPAVAKKKRKTTPTYLRLPVDVKKAIEDQADESRRGFSVEVTIAIEEYLERLGKWPPAEPEDAADKSDRKPRKPD